MKHLIWSGGKRKRIFHEPPELTKAKKERGLGMRNDAGFHAWKSWHLIDGEWVPSPEFPD